MGIFDFVTGGVRELAIARPDEAKDFWVYKHPDTTVPMNAQLTVDSDETVLFFRDGRYVGQFGPGRHTLDSSSIPFLGQLIDKFTGGNVFVAEVFFVNTREHPSIRFGTSVGDVSDPETRMQVRLMVHGSFSARVHDPIRFVTGLVGQRMADNQAFIGWFKSQVQKTIKENIAELIVRKRWPVADVTSGAFTSDIETETVREVRRHVDHYGVEIIRFGDFSINMDRDDRERIARYRDRFAYVDRIAQNPHGYQQFAQAEMMLGAAQGLRKGGAATGNALAGAGVGLGFGMAGQMMGHVSHQVPQQGYNHHSQAPHPTPGHQMAGPHGPPHGQPVLPPNARAAQLPPAPAGPAPGRPGQPGSGHTVTCAACGQRVARGKFCVECGQPLARAAPSHKYCTGCGTPLAGRFCAQCGTPAAS